MGRSLHWSFFILITMVIGTTGCATFHPKPIFPSETASAFEARRLDDPGLKAFIEANLHREIAPWPPASWDFTLLTLAAFYYHPEMEVARARLARAEAATITAGERPNPNAGFTPTYDLNPAAGFLPWTLGFTLDLPIETAGKRGYRIAEARYLANSARLNVAATAWQVRSRIRSSLLDLYGAGLNQELLAKQQAAQNQTVKLLEDRLKAGENSLFEVQIVRVAATQTALQFREAQKQSAQARVRLADALGVPVSALAHVGWSFALFDRRPAPEDAGALHREALLHRPDVLGALAEYDASQAALQLEIAKQYPDIRLGPGYAWDQGENKFTLGVSLTLPVFNRNQGPIAEAEAQRRQAAAAFTALQARVIGEVDRAFAGYRDALSKLETAEALATAQQKRMQSMQESFDAGAADRLELLQAELELHAGELARTAALIETQQALGLLEDAMQRTAERAGHSEVPAVFNQPERNRP